MTARPPGVIRFDSAVVLSGDMVRTALSAVLLGARSQQANRVRPSPATLELAQALADAVSAMSADGHSDVRKGVAVQSYSQQPTVPIDEAAHQLGLSRRQTRRLAPGLGGKIVAGRWLLEQDALLEHLYHRED